MLRATRVILNTCNPPDGVKLGVVNRWLVIIRACVFSMTLTSALLGVLLALRDGFFSWPLALLVVLGLLLAHAANNVLNDLMDFRSGVDTADYFRVQYSPHPLHAGLTSQKGLAAAFLLFSLLDLLLLAYFISLRGWGVATFAVTGFLISVLYVGWTYSLKFIGLGELAVLAVWGPLMVGGTYFVLAGSVSLSILLASLPYGLLVTTVILGKHIDKQAKDAAKGIKTLPVLLGERRALILVKSMIIAFYATITLEAAWGLIPAASLLAWLSLPRAIQVWKTLSQPRPQTPPAGWPIWPLWYVGWCFHLVKLAGGLLIAGWAAQIVIQVLWP